MEWGKGFTKLQIEKSKYKVKCKCGKYVIFYPIIPENKLLCSHCGHYVYKDEKEKFKDLLNKKKKEAEL